MTKLIVGCGYLGQRVADRWLATGEMVYATTRSEERARELRAVGIEPVVMDVTKPESLSGLPVAETVLYAVGFDRSADATKREVYVNGLAAVLDALPEETGRIVYISSTGVYDQDDGGWIDEGSPCEPTNERSRLLLSAEQCLREHPLGAGAVVLRLAGIYGPGRIPLKDRLASNEPIPASPDAYLNLIHVDDAVEIVLAAAEKARPGTTYLVADGQPGRRRDFYLTVAQLAGLPEPRFADSQTENNKRGGTNKRIASARVLADLGVRLSYASYRDGLSAILETESTR